MQDDRRVSILTKTQTEVDVGGIAKTLHEAAKSLLDKEVSAVNVNAACNAAHQISQLIRTVMEARRLEERLAIYKK